ncbi:MAG: hypothetical protein AMJ95_02865 [Omnitrophica WOR_2 bacterium SM23_72]|nr:MAG: hypothetical protein AMJ95_02865 [Omnitrophica WOR_2 bacterium SM23_72]
MITVFLAFVFVLATVSGHAQSLDPEDKFIEPYQKEDRQDKALDYLTITGKAVREKDFKLGPGMEVISLKGTNIVAPKGTRVFDMGSWIKVEDLGEFLGRRFDEMETRLNQLAQQQEQLRQELQEIKESLKELNEKSSTPE